MPLGAPLPERAAQALAIDEISMSRAAPSKKPPDHPVIGKIKDVEPQFLAEDRIHLTEGHVLHAEQEVVVVHGQEIGRQRGDQKSRRHDPAPAPCRQIVEKHRPNGSRRIHDERRHIQPGPHPEIGPEHGLQIQALQ